MIINEMILKSIISPTVQELYRNMEKLATANEYIYKQMQNIVPKSYAPIYSELAKTINSINVNNYKKLANQYKPINDVIADVIASTKLKMPKYPEVIDWELYRSKLELVTEADILLNDDGTITDGINSYNLEEIDLIIDANFGNECSSPTPESFTNKINSLLSNTSPLVLYILLPLILYFFGKFIDPFIEPVATKFHATAVKNGTMVIKSIQKNTASSAQSASLDAKISSRNFLPLWEHRRRKSKIIGYLEFGDRVKVKDKRRNWSKVAIIYEDNSEQVGWTYTRYLKPCFPKKLIANLNILPINSK